MDSSGLFSAKNFKERNVLKLAPDAFAVMNNAFGNNVIAPMDATSSSNFSVPGDKSASVYLQGGITSMNVSSAVAPAGAGRATIEVVAPQYKGLHNDYYIDMANGVRVPYFIPMTEVKIYMKSRYIESDPIFKYRPQYYPVFWGFITGVTESHSGGASTFSLTCADLLNWWAFQKLTLKPSAGNTLYGAPLASQFPTVFNFLNPWEMIYSLFLDTFFIQGEAGPDGSLTSNFVYPTYSDLGAPPDFGNIPRDKMRATLGGLAKRTTEYWARRFGFQKFAGYDALSGDVKKVVDGNEGTISELLASQQGKAPLEMYGLIGPVELQTISESVDAHKSTSSKLKGRTVRAKLDLDFSILSRVQPYGQFSLMGSGAESMENTKLEIANKVCEDSQMEFFLDLNGSFVFKPPMYNLDVAFGSDRTYVLESEDIINFSFGHNTDGIVNFLEVTGPLNAQNPEKTFNGFHIDYESIKRYGIRQQKLNMSYGNTADTLRAIAIAEMARINSKTKTGTVALPLRSELRLGFPVYIRHIDAFYYVSGISHSFTYGSSATTELSLESRRDRVYDDGSVTGFAGEILKGYVTKIRKELSDILAKGGTPDDRVLAVVTDAAATKADRVKPNDTEVLNEAKKKLIESTSGLKIGNDTEGFTEIVVASKLLNPDNVIDNGKPEDGGTESQSSIEVRSNELIHITKDTVPFSDKNGYEHVGAFPYGANLRLDRENNYSFVNMASKKEADTYKNSTLLNISPKTI